MARTVQRVAQPCNQRFKWWICEPFVQPLNVQWDGTCCSRGQYPVLLYSRLYDTAWSLHHGKLNNSYITTFKQNWNMNASIGSVWNGRKLPIDFIGRHKTRRTESIRGLVRDEQITSSTAFFQIATNFKWMSKLTFGNPLCTRRAIIPWAFLTLKSNRNRNI